jgi:Rrf2 family protein
MFRVSAKVDYAIRALAALAREDSVPVKGDKLAAAEHIPFRFLEVTLGELRQSGLVKSRRGSDGGYWLGRPATEITIADIMIAIEGAIVDVRTVMPPQHGVALHSALQTIWDRAGRDLDTLFRAVSVADLIERQRRK